MLLWISFAFLTAAVVALLLRPLRQREVPAVAPAAAADLAVYQDQLRELDAERERGLIVASEIESARAEVARRMIRRSDVGDDASPASVEDDVTSAARASKVYMTIAALLPLAGVSLYLLSGSPNLPAQPFAARQAEPAGETSVVNLISRVEQRLRSHPDDGKGWDVIAPVYLRLGRYGDAAHAFAEANRLEGESVRRLMGFAEATMLAENGVVTEAAKRAAERIIALDPARVEPRIWLALAKEQDGDLAGAAADYRAFLSQGPDDASWRGAVSERLKLVTAKLGKDPADVNDPGARTTPEASAPSSSATSSSAPAASAPGASPSAMPDVSASSPDVSAMSPDEQQAFIASMVDRLATRLKNDGRDLAGWIRLVRAYSVLGRDDDARSAFTDARANFADDRASLDEIDKVEQSLGLASKEADSPQ